MSTDPAALIVAVAALLTAAGGIWSSRAGRKDSAEQQAVATQINQRDLAWKERGETITDLRTESDRKQAELDRERDRARAAEQRLADMQDLVDQHEPWDIARRHERPNVSPAPPLRLPRPRPPAD